MAVAFLYTLGAIVTRAWRVKMNLEGALFTVSLDWLQNFKHEKKVPFMGSLSLQ